MLTRFPANASGTVMVQHMPEGFTASFAQRLSQPCAVEVREARDCDAGADGAKGLLLMRESGAYTVAQDEKSCVVYGMPKEAVRLGGAVDVLPLSRIAGAVLQAAAAPLAGATA